MDAEPELREPPPLLREELPRDELPRETLPLDRPDEEPERDPPDLTEEPLEPLEPLDRPDEGRAIDDPPEDDGRE